jgi:DNA topoisomerase-1
MAKNLVIVESPAKAKTIEKILGKDFKVTSCFGHVRDLEKANMGIDIENGFAPKYKVADDKKKVVKEMKSLMKDAEHVWLATDEDREGEAISWHLCEVLDLDPLKTKRIVFHEITKNAIKSAVENPRTVNLDLVNAQQARRILDRIVGFEISPILWRKISMKNNLSAGRVQSVSVRLLAEREREIQVFKPTSSYKVAGLFAAENTAKKMQSFKANYSKKKENSADAKAFMDSCKGATYTITDIQVKPAKKTPSGPFTTSTMQQEASRKLGYSVSKTMLLAQRLYEAGKITYMRTDSMNLSETALGDIEKTVTDKYGKEYNQARKFKSKNDSAQEAHEAIRPTNMGEEDISNSDQQRLYTLIWQRTMASQMADAQLEKTTAQITISTNQEKLVARGEMVKFDGFLRLYLEGTDDEDEEEDKDDGMLPTLSVGQIIDLKELKATQRYTRPPARFTEAALVKKLEELGIGRPSTYAPTISTIQKRKYVEKLELKGKEREYEIMTLTPDDKLEQIIETETTGADKNKLIPTDLGLLVTDFLKKHFKQVMDYEFTAKIEEQFDEVANGKKVWNSVLGEFYDPFHERVEDTLENAETESGERSLGDHPETGLPIIARMGRYGPMVQMGPQQVNDDDPKPKYAKLQPGQSIETISLEESLVLFLLPRELGMLEEKPIVINIGRFGPYAQHDGLFYSLGKERDPYTIEFDEAQKLVIEKREEKRKSTLKIFEKEKIKVLIGPYGPYIKKGLRNYRIPKERHEDAANITLEEALHFMEEHMKNPRGRKKKAAAKKAGPTKKKAATKKKKKKATKKKTATKKKAAVKKAATKKQD